MRTRYRSEWVSYVPMMEHSTPEHSDADHDQAVFEIEYHKTLEEARQHLHGVDDYYGETWIHEERWTRIPEISTPVFRWEDNEQWAWTVDPASGTLEKTATL